MTGTRRTSKPSSCGFCRWRDTWHAATPAGAEREDLEQIAALALVKAIHRFDPAQGTAFTSFAFPTIIGELKRYFRDCGWSVRVPRSLQELAARVEHSLAPMTAELGRTPTAEELARRLETTVELVLEARATVSAHRADSLDRRLGEDDADMLSNGSAARTRAMSAWKPKSTSTGCWPRCPPPSEKRCGFASKRTSCNARSANASESRRCTYRA